MCPRLDEMLQSRIEITEKKRTTKYTGRQFDDLKGRSLKVRSLKGRSLKGGSSKVDL